MASEAHLLFQSITYFMWILEMQKKLQKKFFDFEINPFALVALNIRFYWETIIHFISCKYVSKKCQDFIYY